MAKKCIVFVLLISTIFNGLGNEFPVVTISDGSLRGFTMYTHKYRPFNAFRQIPYGQPPIGTLRFADPVKNLPWTDTRNAFGESPSCLQLDIMHNAQVIGQEDCLYLNVYRPTKLVNNTAPFPVMVWIHGGAFYYGSGSIYGPNYLLDHNIVLVTINYRLGPLGFLSLGDDICPGNQGMKDVVLALQWVQQNIAAFGGNPNSVTLFGESAGGAATHLLMISPLSKGLFHKAISQSGTGNCFWTITENNILVTRSNAVAEVFKCPTNSSENLVSCLRQLSPQAITSVIQNIWEFGSFPLVTFGPTIEHKHPGAFLNESVDESYAANRVMSIPWMTGFTQTEVAWVVSLMLLNSQAVEAINTQWDNVGPIILNYQGLPSSEKVKLVRTIWEHYMGSKQLSFDTRHDFGDMLTDRYITTGGLQSIRLHCNRTGGATYGYRMTHQGKYSVVQANGWDAKDWGAVHFNDLIYLFSVPGYFGALRPNDLKDFEMIGLMTRLWVNFAVDGRPNTSLWRPVQPLDWEYFPISLLDLKLHPEMLEDFYGERESFWIGLQRN